MTIRCAQRGLTLLEVLASLVIIALLTSVCVPMLRSAARVIGEAQASDVSEAQLNLEAMTDAFVKDSVAFGIPSLDDLATPEIASLDAMAPGTISVTRLTAENRSDDIQCDHVWLVFRHADLVALRFHVLALGAEPDSKERRP